MSILDDCKEQLATLTRANLAFARTYPGDRSARQPVHTVYGGAHLYRADTTRRLGELALASMTAYGPDPVAFAEGVGFLRGAALDRAELSNWRAAFARDAAGLRRSNPHAWLALTVHDRVRTKLQREAVEDFRIDFEDGFGARPDGEEDDAARAAAREVAKAEATGSRPPFLGIRIKSLGEEWKLRAARTLELFVDGVLGENQGRWPDNFVITLPKVTLAEQPRTLVRLFEALERRHRLQPGTLRLEIMVEVTQALIGSDGRTPLPAFLEACEGRCVGAHLGTYDFTASCNITAEHQVMDHPMCDLAKGLMLLAYGGTGVFLSDGATNVMPVGPHRAGALSPAEQEQNRAAVHGAWQVAHRHIRHSLEGGYYQGWDLHPAQLPVRYATCYAFFLQGFDKAAERLRNFVEKAAQATLIGDVFDDAATGQGLLNYFLRALNCGAIDPADLELTGLRADEFGLRSFSKILDARRQRLAGESPTS